MENTTQKNLKVAKTQKKAKERKQKVAKSAIVKLIESKMKAWGKSSTDIKIETSVHPILHSEAGDALIAIRQFQEQDQQTSSKRTRDAFILLHSKNITPLLSQLNSIQDKLLKRAVKEEEKPKADDIIIDEWDINSVQSTYRRVFSEIVAKQMKDLFTEMVKCEGCEIDAPGQLSHDCLKPVEEIVFENFGMLFDKVDMTKANEMCFSTVAETSALPINDVSCFLDKESLRNDQDWMERTEKNLTLLCSKL